MYLESLIFSIAQQYFNRMFAQTQTPVLPPHPPTPSLKSLHLLKNSETRILTVQGA